MEFKKYVKADNRDIEFAIRQGMHPMQRLMLDTKLGPMPYFDNIMAPGKAGWRDKASNVFSPNAAIAHMPGRWLDALLNAEAVTGVKPDETVINALKELTYMSIEKGAYGLPGGLNDDLSEWNCCDLHSLREVMHALAAIAAYRPDGRYMAVAETMMDTFDKYFNYETGRFKVKEYFDDTGCTASYFDNKSPEDFCFAECFGRYIGPLVKFYRVTGNQKALNQAIKLKEVCFEYVLKEDGAFDAKLFGNHTHSTTAMISSLALLGETLNDHVILDRVKRFMEHGLNAIALDFGWCLENVQRDDLVGEINNTTDILEACLALGRMGYEGYFARAERILRGHHLPSQLLDTHFIPEYTDPSDPDTYQLAENSVGSFGFPCPFGHEFEPGYYISFNYDIVGGGVSGLCEAARNRISCNNNIISVNLLFDYKDESIEVKNPYDNGSKLTVKRNGDQKVRVRLMGNCDVKNIKATGCGFTVSGEWLYLNGLASGQEAEITFPMCTTDVDYLFRYYRFKARWTGEAIVAMESKGKRLCFFEEM